MFQNNHSLGRTLVILGVIGFIVSAVVSFTIYSGMDQGAVAAAGFLCIMLGLPMLFPSLFTDKTSGDASTMRIVVFIVVLIFGLIYVKLGWSITVLDELKISQPWIYILGLAFGSKAFQKFAENESKDTTVTKKSETKVEHELKVTGDNTKQ